MAGFQNVHIPIRSISLPSRLQPDSIKIVSDLKKLRACPDSCNYEVIRAKMMRLADTFLRVQEMLSSPLTRKVLSKPGSGPLVEEALNGSMVVIDACGYAREMLLTMRDHIGEVQSSLRRSRGANSSRLESQVKGFLCFRKKAKKETARHAREMKRVVATNDNVSTTSHPEMVIQLLKDVNDISGSLIKALLESFASTTKVNAKWSIVARLMVGSHSTQQRLGCLTEVESVDSTLSSFLRGKNDMGVDLKMTEKRLEALECCILGFEEGLESLFKRLIQYRVSLLNVLTS